MFYVSVITTYDFVELWHVYLLFCVMLQIVSHNDFNKSQAAFQAISWWRHQMETFSALLVICEGNPLLIPHKGQWRKALMYSLICAWINDWANNRGAGDLTRHRDGCWLIAGWRRDTSVQYLLIAHLSIPGFGITRVNWITQVRIFESNYKIRIYNKHRCFSFQPNIRRCINLAKISNLRPKHKIFLTRGKHHQTSQVRVLYINFCTFEFSQWVVTDEFWNNIILHARCSKRESMTRRDFCDMWKVPVKQGSFPLTIFHSQSSS